MANEQYPQLAAETEKEKAIFMRRMFIIEKLDRIFVKEDCLCLGKGNAMFSRVVSALRIIPLKSETCHNYSVGMA